MDCMLGADRKMKVLLDTSMLVAALIESHPSHEWCLHWLQRVHRQEATGVVSAHSLLELYAVLTRLPVNPPIASATAWRLIEHNLHGKVEIVGLSADDYWTLVQSLAERQIRGGRVYDALIAAAGAQAQVEAIVTLNPRHFEQLTHDLQVLSP
ncbi:MAG: PIN domain-containing protein [Fimbriimonadales bacterium]|nr:PIN domain-containing protein [Fimbriimonadales bacterium]